MEEGKRKIEIRNKFLKRRNEIEADVRREKSKAIIHFVDGLDCVSAAENILVYVNYRSEVETKDYIEYLLHNTNKHIFAPRVMGLDIDFWEIDSMDDLEDGYQDIKEPKLDDKRTKYEGDNPDKTVALIPGSAFDKEGGRMGYGKGFFDRYLKKYNNIVKIGIAFSEQISGNLLPKEEHDILMDYIITDERMYFI